MRGMPQRKAGSFPFVGVRLMGSSSVCRVIGFIPPVWGFIPPGGDHPAYLGQLRGSGLGHPVPHPWLGENVDGTPGVVPELAAEVVYEGVQELRVVWVFRAPDSPEQPSLGQHPSGVVRKLLEQPVLGRGQPHRTKPASAPRRVPPSVAVRPSPGRDHGPTPSTFTARTLT